MATNEIIINETDSPKDKATKTVLIFAGSYELKKQMKKLKVDYTKVVKGARTSYILRGKEIGRVVVVL